MDRQERVGGQSQKLIHLIKLAVGVRDVAHLAAIQEERARALPPLRHRTRHMPKRAAELVAGGSIYWVINRAILARQLLTGIIEDRWDDDSRCAGLLLDPDLVRVAPRAMNPFQGGRYLKPADAPPDLGDSGSGADDLPPALRLALVRLALL